MVHHGKPGAAPSSGDEIADLAAKYLEEPGLRGLDLVEARIREAQAESDWDEMSKWHRVRLRLLRLQQQRVMSEQIGQPAES